MHFTLKNCTLIPSSAVVSGQQSHATKNAKKEERLKHRIRDNTIS
jgi:hypothetical protein